MATATYRYVICVAWDDSARYSQGRSFADMIGEGIPLVLYARGDILFSSVSRKHMDIKEFPQTGIMADEFGC